MDFFTALDRLKQEWPVIAGAPFSFAITVFIVSVVVYLLTRLHDKAIITQKDEQLKTKEERLGAKEDNIAHLTKTQQDLTEQLRSVSAKLNEYNREFDHGFHPTMDRVADGLIALSDMMRKVPIKIVATPEAHPFAEQLATALTSMRYKVLPHGKQTQGIVPARTFHNKIIVRYEDKATNPLHTSICKQMHDALTPIIAHEVRMFPENDGRDYFQIELLGGP